MRTFLLWSSFLCITLTLPNAVPGQQNVVVAPKSKQESTVSTTTNNYDSDILKGFQDIPLIPNGKEKTPIKIGAPGADPTILFTGPTTKILGRVAIIKCAAIGDDLKIDCSPKNDYWMLVKFFDNTVGIIMDADKAATYTFVGAVNGNGKTAIASYVLTVTDPNPVIPPAPIIPVPIIPVDPIVKKVQDAFATDLASGTAKPEHKAELLAAYQQGLKTFLPTAKTNADLAGQQKTLNEKMIGSGTCPTVRAVIAAETLAVLGKDGTTPINVPVATTLWNKFILALSN
jgi:hypothetical protein